MVKELTPPEGADLWLGLSEFKHTPLLSTASQGNTQ